MIVTCGDLWRNLSNIFQQELSLLWKLQHIGFHFPSVYMYWDRQLIVFLTAVPGDVLLAPPDVHGLRDHGGRQCEHDSALFHADLAVSIHSLTLHSFEVVIAVNLSRNLWSVALLLSKHHLVNHTISVVYRWIFFLILIFFKSQIRFLDKMLAYREWLLKIILKNTLSIWFMFLPSQVVHADSPGLLQGVHHESV